MPKNNSIKSSLDNVGKGIFDSLKEGAKIQEEIKSNNDIENKNVNTKIPESNISLNDKYNKKVSTNKNKRVNTNKNDKNKRSFMLSDTAIKQLDILKMVTGDDLSAIVNTTIEEYFKKSKKKVEQFLDNLKGIL
jgi:DNA anti-recombination protein RmuC